MSGTTEPTNDQKIGTAYLDTIASWAGFDTNGGDSGSALFLSKSVSRSPAAGRSIGSYFTNDAVETLGDALLDPDHLYYQAGENQASYFNAVQAWIVGADLSRVPGFDDQLKVAGENAQNAQTAYMDTLKKAREFYNSIGGAKDNGDFVTWASSNYPSLSSISATNIAAQVNYDNILAKQQGPLFATLSNMRAKLAATQPAVGALQTYHAGLNMYACDEQININLANYAKLLQEGKKTPKAKQPALANCRLVPAYKIDNTYANQMDEWMSIKPENAVYLLNKDFSTSSSSQSSNNTYGHNETTINHSTFFGLISWQTTKSTPWEKHDTNSQSGSISFNLKARDAKRVTISPEDWDVPNFAQEFPKVLPGVANQTLGKSRLTSLLLGIGVELTVTFTGDQKTSFDSQWSKSSGSAGSRVSVLGFEFSASDDPNTDSGDTHTGTYNKNTGTLSIKPTDGNGTAAILGVIAQKYPAAVPAPTS